MYRISIENQEQGQEAGGRAGGSSRRQEQVAGVGAGGR